MKFSNFVPEYSILSKLLVLLDKLAFGSLYNLLKKTESIDFDNYGELSLYSIEKIKKDFELSDKIFSDLVYFYEKTGIIPSSKYIIFCENHGLLSKVIGSDIGVNNSFYYYNLTERGERFIKDDLIVKSEIDNKEMLLLILEDLSKYKESDDFYLDDFFPLLNVKPNYEFTESRCNNLMDRGLLTKKKSLSKKGLYYLSVFENMRSGISYLEKYFLAQNDIERMKMMEWLLNINPYDLEHLIALLLKKIGYKNIKVTPKGSDGGIDIIAEIKSGTSCLREIIQVKRWRKNVQRPTLDQLRGVLSISKAIKGTIITTSDFSQGCYENLQDNDSITLINGKKLIDLFIANDIGFQVRDLKMYMFNPPV